ncbi:MAG: bifunctional DNA primase/polymerase, partial [Polyangiaceae bacterium]
MSPLKFFPLLGVIRGADGTVACTCTAGATCRNIGKHPAVPWSVYDGDETGPDGACGIPTGDRNGIFVVDLDVRPATDNQPAKDGRTELTRLAAAAGGEVPPTLTVDTPSGGEHLYFRLPPGVYIPNAQAVAPGVDVRGEGGYVVGPGSPHRNGGRYQCRDESAALAEPPAWLLVLVAKVSKPRKTRPAHTADGTIDSQSPEPTTHRTIDPGSPEGVRAIAWARTYLSRAEPAIEGQNGSGRLFHACCHLMYSALPLGVLQQLVEEVYNPRCEPPWSPQEISHKLTDADRVFAEPRGLCSPDFFDRLRRAANGATSGDGAEPTRGDDENLNLADQVIRVVTNHAELFHDPSETPYAIVTTRGIRRVMRLRSAKMRSWIARTVVEDLGRSVGATQLDQALTALEGAAIHDCDKRKVHLRVAEHESAIYIDIGDETGACIEVSAAGWRIRDAAPVLFWRPDAMRALPRPEQGGKLDDLRPFVNAADDDALLLFVAWIVYAYRPGRPFPVLALHGEQGTAKSTASKVARACIDPNAAPIRSVPRSEDDLAVASVHSHVIAFDNLSGVQPWLSDALCRLATGGGLSKRTHYTNDEETVLDAIRPIIVNGIDDLANRADLAERCLVLTLLPIEKKKRRDEEAFWRVFAAAAPGIFGYLLDGVASALRHLPTVQIDELPRMADFARWIAAAEPGLRLPPGTLLSAYERNRTKVVEVAIDASPVASAVLRLLNECGGRWTGSPTQALAALGNVTPQETRRAAAWPKTEQELSSAMTRSATFLRQVGVELIRSRAGHDRHRVWTIARAAPTRPSANADDADGPSAYRPQDRPHESPEQTCTSNGADDADDVAAFSPL